MITVHQLADIISRSPKGTALKQISRQPGNERYAGLCPLPGHKEKTASFQVYVGSDGAGHYHCKGCQQNGSATWWLMKVEGQTFREAGGGVWKPDPSAARARRDRRRVREAAKQAFLNYHPDSAPEAQLFVDFL